MKIALIQFNAGQDKDDNIRRALEFIRKAAEQRAEWVLLPEVFSFRGNLLNQEVLKQIPEAVPGTITSIFQKAADRYQVSILLGSIIEASAQSKPYNTSVFLHPQSSTITKYRKIHLFDAVVDDKIVREQDYFSQGIEGEVVDCGQFKVGLSICYDLRFPDLYRNYAKRGANVLTAPSCFTKTTGQAHWETLVRARAIENLSYVLAPNQIGSDARGIQAYGHSLVVSPWGEVIARGSADKEEIIYAELSMKTIQQARAKLPGIVKDY